MSHTNEEQEEAIEADLTELREFVMSGRKAPDELWNRIKRAGFRQCLVSCESFAGKTLVGVLARNKDEAISRAKRLTGKSGVIIKTTNAKVHWM